MSEIKYLDFAGLTAYDKKIKAWIKSGTVDITDDEIRALFKTEDEIYFTVNGLFPISVPQVNYNAIDLGLPSGIKWADRNVGASSPSDYGSYFSWGNVEGVTRFNGVSMSDDEVLTLYMTLEGVPSEMIPSYIEEVKQQEGWENEIDMVLSQISTNDIYGYSFDETTYASTAGGQFTGSTLDAEHDAATANMGNDWRMPTTTETVELVEGTDHYYIGEDGNIVAESELSSSKKLRSICFVKKDEEFDYNNRSNFIEIPFAGYCVHYYNSGSSLEGDGSVGNIWSSSADKDDARYLFFNCIGILSGDFTFLDRLFGHSVRGVRA